MCANNLFLPAESLINELGITEPDEIDIEAIAFYCGAIVQYASLDGCDARIIGNDKKAIITVDKYTKPERQRFSIGHELGHWMRDRGKAAFLCQENDMASIWEHRQDPESKANEYAADLLLPLSIFRALAKHRDMTFKEVRDLAHTFRTSLTATALRFVQYGSLPAILVCYGKTGRKWFVRGPSVSVDIWPTDELSYESPALDLLYKNVPQKRPIEVGANQWINHKGSYRYAVVEDSIKISDDSILTLVWWKDKSQLVDLYL